MPLIAREDGWISVVSDPTIGKFPHACGKVRGRWPVGASMDLAHGASFYPPALVRTATIQDMVDADVIVIAAGRGGRPGESRLDLLRENAALIGDIGKRLTRARGTVVVVSNPVDVLTQR